MLKGEDIKAASFIKGMNDACIRSASYDLQVGQILTSDGKTHQSHILKKQGLIKVISLERVELPSNICGTVLIKTSLSDRGVLALNIGIIDPSYKGKISSYLVNFSDDNQPINFGDQFLRVTFVKIDGKSEFDRPFEISDENYWSRNQHSMVTGFSDTFLNYEKIMKDFVDESLGRYRNSFLAYVSTGAFVLALLVLFLNFGNVIFARRWLDPQTSLKEIAKKEISAEQKILNEENYRLRDNLRELEARLERLEKK